MTRVLIFLAFSSFFQVVSFAQLQLNIVQNGAERPVGTVHDLGSAPVTDVLATTFRVRNLGTSAATITTLSVRGTGFTMTGQPSLPHIIVPGLNMDFTIRFLAQSFGSYSANLSVNSISVLVRAAATASAVVSVDQTVLSAGSTVDFGRIERKSTATKRFSIQNGGPDPLTLSNVRVTGDAFKLASTLPGAPLAPGTSADLNVVFEPATSGILSGSLQIADRSFRLVGTAIEPPFPRPAVIIDLPLMSSGQQGKVSVRLANPSQAIGTGKLRITAADSDAAIQFVTTGTRVIDFTVAEGQDRGSFGGSTEGIFQTGTTAGNIVITAEVGGYTEQASVTINPTAVSFDTTRGSRSGSTLDIQLAGFDNTRSASQMAFTFFDTAGRQIQPGAIRVDATADFRRYFTSSTLGGIFSMRAQFPVTGDASGIAGVEVEMVNASGTSRSQRIRF